MKRFLLFVAVTVLYLLCFQVNAAETIKVGSVYAHSGSAAVGNKNTIDGIRFAVEKVNQKGGSAYYSSHWHVRVESPKSRRFYSEFSAIHGSVESDSAALANDAVFVKAVSP